MNKSTDDKIKRQVTMRRHLSDQVDVFLRNYAQVGFSAYVIGKLIKDMTSLGLWPVARSPAAGLPQEESPPEHTAEES